MKRSFKDSGGKLRLEIGRNTGWLETTPFKYLPTRSCLTLYRFLIDFDEKIVLQPSIFENCMCYNWRFLKERIPLASALISFEPTTFKSQ